MYRSSPLSAVVALTTSVVSLTIVLWGVLPLIQAGEVPKVVDAVPPIDPVVGTVGVAAVVTLVFVGVWLYVIRKRSMKLSYPEPVVEAQPTRQWADSAKAVYQRVQDAIATISSDALQAFELGSLFDVQVKLSGVFWTKWVALEDEMRRLDDHVSAEAARRVLRLAGDAEASWTVALEAARRLGLDYYPQRQRPDAQRALSLLRLASDTTASTNERGLAMAAAARILATLNLAHLPQASRKALTVATKPPLTA